MYVCRLTTEAELSLPLGRFLLERFVLVAHQESAVNLGSFMMGDELPPFKEVIPIRQASGTFYFLLFHGRGVVNLKKREQKARALSSASVVPGARQRDGNDQGSLADMEQAQRAQRNGGQVHPLVRANLQQT